MTDSVQVALHQQLELDRAYRAARAGDLALAGEVLDNLGAAGRNTPAALDLRARVHAQRGELEMADRCWAQVQESTPHDPDAAEGRRTIAEIQAGKRRARPVVHAGWVAAGGVGLTVTALVVGTAWLVPTGLNQVNEWVGGWEDRARAEARQARAEERRADAAEQRLAEREEARASTAADRDEALDAIVQSLELPGVRVELGDQSVRVLFDEGVFLYDTVPRSESPDLLRRLGNRLADLEVSTTVVGHSVPVPGEDTSGGSELAQRRAQEAAGYLSEGGGLPLTAFALTVADQAEGPFEAEARNRTVSLVVQPEPNSSG